VCRSMGGGVARAATAAATPLVDRKFESKSQPHASSFHGPFVSFGRQRHGTFLFMF
jgi:hypothetical protein